MLFPTLTSASSYATQTFGVTSNIAGENPGTKLDKAKALGVAVIGEKELEAMLQ